jgi:hypothetical protein
MQTFMEIMHTNFKNCSLWGRIEKKRWRKLFYPCAFKIFR